MVQTAGRAILASTIAAGGDNQDQPPDASLLKKRCNFTLLLSFTTYLDKTISTKHSAKKINIEYSFGFTSIRPQKKK
jgi:hypothetical protein